MTKRFPWVLAFIFGFLPGFGFAGALVEIDLPMVGIPPAPLTFSMDGGNWVSAIHRRDRSIRNRDVVIRDDAFDPMASRRHVQNQPYCAILEHVTDARFFLNFMGRNQREQQ